MTTNPVEQDGVVVPREPTQAMLDAGWRAYEDKVSLHGLDGPATESAAACYAAMLAAAPAPELTRPDGRVNESRESEHDTQPEALGELPEAVLNAQASIFRATVEQIDLALGEHGAEDPFVLVDPIALLGWSMALSKLAGCFAMYVSPRSDRLGELPPPAFVPPWTHTTAYYTAGQMRDFAITALYRPVVLDVDSLDRGVEAWDAVCDGGNRRDAMQAAIRAALGEQHG